MARITQNRRIALFSLWSFNQSEAGEKNPIHEAKILNCKQNAKNNDDDDDDDNNNNNNINNKHKACNNKAAMLGESKGNSGLCCHEPL